MNIITSPHYNRPQCTSALIRSLKESIGIGDWHVIFVCEPGCPEVLDLCKNADLPSYEVVENTYLQGLWDNKKLCLELGFKKSNFVLHLEDDLLVSKDALLFYSWCDLTYAGQSDVFTINGFNKIKAIDFYSRRCGCCNSPFYGQVGRRAAYNSLGFATWKNRYTNVLDTGGWNGSDIWLEQYRATRNLCEVYPILSRINNIGFIQGSSFDDEVAKTLLKQGIKPDSLIGSTVDNLVWNSGRPDIMVNEYGCEWVKLNKDKCRSRKDPQFHKNNTYLEFWAGRIEYEYGRFFE